MSKYTTEVRFICEQLAGLDESKGYASVDNVITKSRGKIFDFDYPIFDEGYKPLLEKKILKHFYTREICEETYGLWHLRLDAKMNEIMPYYNKMYESELLKYNPLDDVNKKITHQGSDSGKSTDSGVSSSKTVRDGTSGSNVTEEGTADSNTVRDGTSKTTVESERWDLFSDTPQGGISGIERAYDGVDDNAYLTDARNIKDNSETNNEFEDESTTTASNTNEKNVSNQFEDESNTSGSATNNRTFNNENSWVEVISGKQGTKSYSTMLLEFRKTFLNIDSMILEELNGLFFQLY